MGLTESFSTLGMKQCVSTGYLDEKLLYVHRMKKMNLE